MIKHLDCRRLNRSVQNGNKRVNAETYRGATTEAMQYHIKPCLKRKPDEIILHVGTNDLKEGKCLIDVAKRVLKVCNIIKKESPETQVVISELITRSDSSDLKDQVKEVNKNLFTICDQNCWSYIRHKNIGVNHLNTYGVHLNRQGTATLAKNILSYLNRNTKQD